MTVDLAEQVIWSTVTSILVSHSRCSIMLIAWSGDRRKAPVCFSCLVPASPVLCSADVNACSASESKASSRDASRSSLKWAAGLKVYGWKTENRVWTSQANWRPPCEHQRQYVYKDIRMYGMSRKHRNLLQYCNWPWSHHHLGPICIATTVYTCKHVHCSYKLQWSVVGVQHVHADCKSGKQYFP